MACLLPRVTLRHIFCSQQTNDSTLERIKNKVELETRETLDYKQAHKTSRGTASHSPSRVFFALILNRAFSPVERRVDSRRPR
jgi:hypothetical protein